MARDFAGVEVIHPAIDLALDEFPAQTALRAAASLRSLLQDRITADGDRAWSSSRLTGDGFPMEITFTTADERLRYTVEPGSAALEPRQRLGLAIRLVNSLGVKPIPENIQAALSAVQDSGGLRFGAWVGGRHHASENEHKIYVETSRTGAALRETLGGTLGKYPEPLATGAHLRMISYSPASQDWELYYRVKSLAPDRLGAVLAPMELMSRGAELRRCITGLYGFTLGERLPGESIGVSYTVRAHEVRLATVFFFARALWGGDARIREQFGRWSSALGWDDTRYQRITAALAARRTWKTYHGILGITLSGSFDHMPLSIGVRPQNLPREVKQ